jgi:hypothetical protein
MDILKIEKTSDTPNVILDSTNNLFEFSYRSLPENAIDFYNPILDWIEEYSKNPNNETVVDFKLEYFNTASAKQIAKVLLKLLEISKKAKVKINWYYDKNDTDMLASGQRYSKLINLEFEFIEI